MFCSFPSAKTCPFFCRAKRAFPSGKTLILPISRDSRYNTLHFASKVVCQRVPLWKPYFVGVCSHTSSKMQNKRHRPARSRCCSIPLICLHGLLILSPILTVLFYHFCMYGGFTHAELLCGTAHSSFVLYDILPQHGGSVLNILLHRNTPLSVILVLHYMLSFSLIIPLFVLKKNLNAHHTWNQLLLLCHASRYSLIMSRFFLEIPYKTRTTCPASRSLYKRKTATKR